MVIIMALIHFIKRCKLLVYKNLFESFINIWRCVVHTINSITPATEVQITENVLQNKDLRATSDVACSEPPQKPNSDTRGTDNIQFHFEMVL